MSDLPVVAGSVLRIGDDVNTDLIYPARFMPLRSPQAQASHAFAGMDADISTRVHTSRIVVAGWNLGCGSSREQAVTAIRAAGVQLVVARSFARLFFRNCINTGMPVIESAALVDHLADGLTVSVDLNAGLAMVAGQSVSFAPLPDALKKIIVAGGLLHQLNASRCAGGDGRPADATRKSP